MPVSPVGLEGVSDEVKVVGFGAEVAELLAFGSKFIDGQFHGRTVIAVITVAFDHQWVDIFATENVLKGIFDRGGTGAGRAGNGDNRVLYGHIVLLKLSYFS